MRLLASATGNVHPNKLWECRYWLRTEANSVIYSRHCIILSVAKKLDPTLTQCYTQLYMVCRGAGRFCDWLFVDFNTCCFKFES